MTATIFANLNNDHLVDSELMLEFIADFQNQLSITDLIQKYFDTTHSLLNIQGVQYQYPLFSIDNHYGSSGMQAHACDLTINSDFWGTITLYRHNRFNPSEEKQIKHINSLLLPSLKSLIIQESSGLATNQKGIIGLAKSLFAEQLISREAKIAFRENTPVSIVLLDIDRFNIIDQQSDKLDSDNLIYNVTQKIQSTIRETDLLIRCHKDSFCLVLRGACGENAISVSERIRTIIDKASFIGSNNKPLHITISAGVAELSESDSLEASFKKVKNALQLARSKGHNQSHLADDLRIIT